MKNINTRQSRQLIAFYSYFRIIIATTLICITIYSSHLKVTSFLATQLVFIILSVSYISICIFQLFTSRAKQHRFLAIHLSLAILFDEAFILSLIFLSGGTSTGIGIFLITPISIAAIFFTGNSATFFAAIAAIGILTNHIYLIFTDTIKDQDEIQIGVLGITFFIVSIGVQYLSRYIRTAQQEAIDSELKAELLTELNQHIVQRIRTGIIIFDDENQLILNNKAAQVFLQNNHPDARVLALLDEWKTTGENNHALSPEHSPAEMQINFSALNERGHIITFIDDISDITQQALQMKLASLGRLSASIAHEIRNPLNAISHSVQLLEESPDLSDKADIRLLNIAGTHIKRIDEIVRNILGMSRQQQYQPERLELIGFVDTIKEEYLNNHQYPHISFEIDTAESEIMAPFDSSQLQQILSNLIDNGLRYSFQHTAQYSIRLELSYDDNKAVLNIYDNGVGVPEENQGKLFEPFFTSESTGTGLGLYLSRELCTLNQSQLSYNHCEGINPHFQIRFAHADRDILVKTSNSITE